VNSSENFDTNTGLQQGDALACLLCDIALEKAIEEAEIDRLEIEIQLWLNEKETQAMALSLQMAVNCWSNPPYRYEITFLSIFLKSS